jgi:dsRNA-specific ribonuclease
MLYLIMTEKGRHNPYNKRNRVIPSSVINSILKAYGIKSMKSSVLYRRALTHNSYTYEGMGDNETLKKPTTKDIPIAEISNERLEFLGDGVLELVTKSYLYARFPGEDEGFMTEKKISLVKNEHIGKLALALGLNKWYILSISAEEKNTRSNLKKWGCLFEAWLGAIFLDHGGDGRGYAAVAAFIQNVFEKHVDWHRLLTTDDNYKNILQVRIQKTFKTTPDYVELSHSKEKGYNMAVLLALGKPIYQWDVSQAIPFTRYGGLSQIKNSNGPVLVHLAQSSHRVKKKAEQGACLIALQRIGFHEGN